METRISSEGRQVAVQQFEQILRRATEKKASDVHLKAGLPPIVRVNGVLYYLSDELTENVTRLTNSQLLAFTQALMSARQLERYDNGEEVDLGYELQGIGRFRINVCQQRGNPRFVCRCISDTVLTIDELGLPKAVEKLASSQRGMILLTGATGSGKSTTLAAIIDQIARTRSCHIVTIEDPIEFTFKDRRSIITQREVGMDTKNFSLALKYALRQDPDVVLVGEMRDQETIMMALAAAETGHLVLSTLHTVDAPETINRILGTVETGMQSSVRSQLASVLVGVISQRLLRRKDKPGRIAALEILLCNQRVKDLIADPQRTMDLHRVIHESGSLGMQTFDQSLMKLFQQGLITQEDALNNCSNVRDFQLMLEGVVQGDFAGKKEGEIDEEASRAAQVKAILQKQGKDQSIEIDGLNSDGSYHRKKRKA